MSNFTDFFPAAGGGGGGIPNYQEFTSSGTFTPTQGLIDAGGRVAFIIVGGGQRGGFDNKGGAGGGVKFGYATLTSTTGCAVTIGAGGASQRAAGGDTTVAFSSGGGTDVIAAGGNGEIYSAQFGNSSSSGGREANAASSGVLGYSVGGRAANDSAGANGKQTNYDNYGSGSNSVTAASGFVRITWFE